MRYFFQGIFAITTLILLPACSEQAVYTSQAQVTQRYTENIIKAADISDDGQFTLWSDNQVVCLWNNITNEEKYCLEGIEAQLIELLGISSSQRYFYTSNRVNVHLYNLNTGRLVAVWSAGDNIINDIAIANNDSTLVFGFRNGQASVVSVQSNQINTFKPHRLDINSVSISADGKKAFTGSSDKQAVLWNTQTGETVTSFTHQTRVNHVVLSLDAKTAYTLDAIRDRFFWQIGQQVPLSELNTPIKFIEFNDACFDQQNKWLLSGSPKQKLALWQVSNGAKLAEWQTFKTEQRDRASVLAVSIIDDNQVASFTSDGVYQTWPLNLSPIDH